jgi:hypothetical protein
MRRTRLFGFCLLTLSLSACSEGFSAFFSNPCPTPVTVTTYDYPPEKVESVNPEGREFEVTSFATVFADLAFSDSAGYETWSVRVGESDQLLRIEGANWVTTTIPIPESFCEDSASE